MASSWIWMKGIEVAIADPIDPIDYHDKRPSVKDLISQHRAKIDEITAEVSKDPLCDAKKHDDLWILRFLLSHKKSRPAIKAAKHTLQYRKDHDLDSRDLRSTPPHKNTEDAMLQEYFKIRLNGDAIVPTMPDPLRGICEFSELRKINHKAVETLSVETWHHAFINHSEWVHQWLDYDSHYRTPDQISSSHGLDWFQNEH